MIRGQLIALALALSLAAGEGAVTATAQPCPADCDGDGGVAINELVRCVNVALGGGSLAACTACDTGGDGAVAINELIAAVGAALGACPPTGLPTPTPTDTALAATPTAPVTPSPTTPSTIAASPSGTPTTSAAATSTPPPSATAIASPSSTSTPTVSPGDTQTATATSSATPSRSPSSPTGTPACAATPLPSGSSVSMAGSTAGASDTAGGASCGFGGGSGFADAVFEYVAPAAGIFDIGTDDASVGVLLYVRDQSCAADEAELACADNPGDAAVVVELAAGQRVAIVVDGSSPGSGSFVLRVRRRQPDLVVLGLTAPSTAQAGELVELSAEIANQGDLDAGPLNVEFVYARDAALAAPITQVPLVCGLSGLAAGAVTTCAPLNRLSVPLVAAGEYFVGARIDADAAIDERVESNNVLAQAASIEPAPGVELRQEMLRAADGTAYQIISAVPSLMHTDAGGFQLTTLAGSAASVAGCATVDGGMVRAAVGAAVAVAPATIRRTRLLRPASFPVPEFDNDGSGRLRLDSGPEAVEVCADGACGGEPLAAIAAPGGEIAGGCAASRAGGFCGDGAAPEAIGFGIAADAGACTDPTRPTVQAALCAMAPSDGFRLRAGEQVVFVHDADRAPFGAGVAGFALAATADNARGCVANRVIDPVELRDAAPGLPLFRLLQREISGSAADVAVSAGGRFVYVLDGGGGLTAFERPLGAATLRRIDVEREGDLNAQGRVVRGLVGGTRLLLSPDGAQLYVLSLLGVAVFQRDVEGGTLAFSDGGASIGFTADAVITPDGGSIYVSGFSGMLVVLRRDPETGRLAEVDSVSAGGNALVVSPDSRHLYIGTQVMQRDPQTGELELLQQLDEADALGTALAVSADGTYLYSLTAAGIRIYQRGTRTPLGVQDDGRLFAVGLLPATTQGIVGAVALAASRTGNDLYVASLDGGTIAVFRGNAETNGLDPIPGPGALPGASRVVVSADGGTVAALSQSTEVVALFGRDESSGALTPLLSAAVAFASDDLPDATAFAVSPDGETVYSNEAGLRADRRDPVDGRLTPIGTLQGVVAAALAVSPDSKHVYTVTEGALAVFRRDAADAVPVLVETEQDGAGGVDGLAGATAVVVSGDGAHVYAAGSSDGAVAVFSRDPATGALQFLQVVRDPLEELAEGPTSLALSPDGLHLYVAGASMVLLHRDPLTGLLAAGEPLAVAALSGRPTVVVTGDGRHVYFGGSGNPVDGYAREVATGALQHVDFASGGGFFTTAPLVESPDGAYLYLPGIGIGVLSRDSLSGALSGLGGIEVSFDNFFTGVAISPDSRHVYFARHVYARAE